MLNSVYDCYSALCPKVTETRRTSVCWRTMSACLLTGRKRRQLLGGSSHSESDSVPVLWPDSDRGLAALVQ